MSERAYLLDTNVLVYLLAGAAGPLRQRLERQPVGSLATSSLCVAEALSGLGDEAGVTEAFESLLEVVAPLPFDLAAARRFTEVPFRGGRLDRFIAAHCLALDLVLVTDNEDDFRGVAGLKVENWMRP